MIIGSDSDVKKSVRQALLYYVTSVIRRILVYIWREHQIGGGVEYPEAVLVNRSGFRPELIIPRANH